MERDQHIERVGEQVVNAGQLVAEALCEQIGQRPGEGDIVIGKQPGRHLHGQQAEQTENR